MGVHMIPEDKVQINISTPSLGRDSRLSEIQKKLQEGASKFELQRLVLLEMTSIVNHHGQLMDALAPSRFHRRNRTYRQHARVLMAQLRGLRILGKFIKSDLPDRDDTDLEGKLSGIVDTIVAVAVDCLKRTVHNEQLIVETWTRLFFHELEKRNKDIFGAIDK